MTSWCLSSSFFVLFLCTQRSWWLVGTHHHLFLFYFCAHKEDDDKRNACCCFVLFCLYALVFMRPNGCFVSTWSKHTPFECKLENQGVHLFILRGLGNKITVLWMFVFWATHMQGKNGMRRRAFDQMKKKVELKWDEFQA